MGLKSDEAISALRGLVVVDGAEIASSAVSPSLLAMTEPAYSSTRIWTPASAGVTDGRANPAARPPWAQRRIRPRGTRGMPAGNGVPPL